MKDNIIVFMVYWSQVHFIFKASMVSFKKHLWKYLKFKQALLKRCWLHHNAHKQENVPQCDVLEKEMATHSSVLAWRIPGTGEPDGLPPMGSHRVRHDWSNLAAAAAVMSLVFNSGVYKELIVIEQKTFTIIFWKQDGSWGYDIYLIMKVDKILNKTAKMLTVFAWGIWAYCWYFSASLYLFPLL